MDTEHRRVQKQTNALYVGYRHGTCIRETNKQGSEGCCCIMSYQRGGLRRHAASQSQVKSSSYSPHPHKIIPPVFDRLSGCFQCSLCKLVQRTPPSLGFPLPKQPWAEVQNHVFMWLTIEHVPWVSLNHFSLESLSQRVSCALSCEKSFHNANKYLESAAD